MTEQTLPETNDKTTELTPLLPLRDVVVYPHLVIPLFVGRAKSVKALEIASDTNKEILLVAQKSANKDDPEAEDLYEIGTLATVLQMLKLPDGTVKVLVEGLHRVRVSGFVETEDCFMAHAETVEQLD
jgi:ATP-dependent Lon protease